MGASLRTDKRHPDQGAEGSLALCRAGAAPTLGADRAATAPERPAPACQAGAQSRKGIDMIKPSPTITLAELRRICIDLRRDLRQERREFAHPFCCALAEVQRAA